MPDTLRPPPEVVASWPTPNYMDPENRGPALEYLCIILSALSICIIIARLYSRLFITKAPGFDDFLIVCALGFSIALSVLVVIGNRVYYSGYHIWDVPPTTGRGHRLNVWISQWCYLASSACVKISILLFYRRLSVTFTKIFLIATWAGIIYNIAYFIGFGLSLLLLCRPVEAYWTSFDRAWLATHEYHCNSEGLSLPLSGVFSVIGDFYSAFLPMLLIMTLEIPRRQKLSLFALFAIAFLVVGAGIVRTVLLNELINKNYDFTWVLWEAWIWAMVELYVAILAASAPALKPFFRRFLVEPISTAVDSGRRKSFVLGSRGTSSAEPRQLGHKASKSWTSDGGSRPGSRYSHDVEKSRHAREADARGREENFARELDNNTETRHFELTHSRDGKIVPMQVWKLPTAGGQVSKVELTALPDDSNRNSGISIQIINWPVPPQPINHTPRYEPRPVSRSDSRQGHVRNFSQPHPPIYDSPNRPQSQPQGHHHKLSHGDFQSGHRRAGTDPSKPMHAHKRSNSSTASRNRPRPQNIFNTNLSPTWRMMGSGERRESHLDSPSDSDESNKGQPKQSTNANQAQKHVRISTDNHSRNTSASEETLGLPRMGISDFFPEWDREHDRPRDLAKERQMALQREKEREQEAERQRIRNWERERERRKRVAASAIASSTPVTNTAAGTGTGTGTAPTPGPTTATGPSVGFAI